MPVLDVSAWPVDNGFERFVDLFAENKVDSGVLRELTDHHLKDLRIPLIGWSGRAPAPVSK